jgi:hypothetical protein
MLSFRRVLFATLAVTPATFAACPADRPLSLCCMNVAPFSTNSGVWGGVCGYQPSSPGEIVGARCGQFSGPCPSQTRSTCCERLVLNSGQCALAAKCGPEAPTTPSTTSSTTSTTVRPTPTAFVVPSLPAGWRVESPCVILDSVSTIGPRWGSLTNTPANCVNYCAGDGYKYAAVTNGEQCMCSNEYKAALATPAVPLTECNGSPCSGDSSQYCGASGRVTVFTFVSATSPALPSGWTEVNPCAVDDQSRVLSGDTVTTLSNNSPFNCAKYCEDRNYLYAGVEYGSECRCGNGLSRTPTNANIWECNMGCSGDSSQFCGAGWRIQIYKSPALAPGSWTLRGCAVDTPSTPAFVNNVYVTPDNNVDLPSQCDEICRKRGLPYAGPIAGTTCTCGTALSPSIQFVDSSECSSLCPEPPGVPGQVFCGGPSRVMVYAYSSN